MVAKRVVVVEDDAGLRSALTRVLLLHGYTVVSCHSAEQALAMTEWVDLDVAILDLRLPRMCGDDLARHLRSSFPNLRLILITGEEQMVPRLRRLPDQWTVLEKPFELPSLMEALEGS